MTMKGEMVELKLKLGDFEISCHREGWRIDIALVEKDFEVVTDKVFVSEDGREVRFLTNNVKS
jgi:hypothetical protein